MLISIFSKGSGRKKQNDFSLPDSKIVPTYINTLSLPPAAHSYTLSFRNAVTNLCSHHFGLPSSQYRHPEEGVYDYSKGLACYLMNMK